MGGHWVLDLQRITGNAAVTAALQDDEQSPVHEVLGLGQGRLLEPEVCADMKARLGHDFSHVRVHDDSGAHESATAVNAHAYTVGSDIVFQRGAYDPATPEGKLTLAHELTHVVQQSRGPVDGTETPGGIRISESGDRFEREAAANAENAVSTPAPAVSSAADVQRDPAGRWHLPDGRLSQRPAEAVARGHLGGLPGGLRGLQRTVGNRATAAVLQRQADKPPPKPKASSKPVVDEAAASRDYTNANTYVGQFYQGVLWRLEQLDKVRAQAVQNYKDIAELKDPPSLSEEIFKSVVGLVMSKIPGWDLIQKGLEIGMFASELGRLKLELEETPIPGYTAEDAKKAGPSAETKETAKKRIEYGKTGFEAGKKIYETVTDVLEKRKAAQEAEAKALESAGLGQERITDWAQAAGKAQKEQLEVTKWVKQAGADKKLAGGVEAAVRERLGPIPIIDPNQVDPLIKRYELELYRTKFQATSKYVVTTTVVDFRKTERKELRVPGGLSQATRRRIAACAGVSRTDDETMAAVLVIPATRESEYPGHSVVCPGCHDNPVTHEHRFQVFSPGPVDPRLPSAPPSAPPSVLPSAADRAANRAAIEEWIRSQTR
jgi:Domain of unknown function (DUF4157)